MEELLKIRIFTAEELLPLWNNGIGLCTSFATYIASRLEDSDCPTLVQFAKFNGIHRACFSRDGIIVDSSTKKTLEVTDQKPISGYRVYVVTTAEDPVDPVAPVAPEPAEDIVDAGSPSNVPSPAGVGSAPPPVPRRSKRSHK
ncbi:hypothetical protein HL42_0731 [Trichophyton rubrum]|nr:hypothetical protein HL42_0731 [Trichophyton rubrum]